MGGTTSIKSEATGEAEAPDLLWHSSVPWSNSGYGVQTDLVAGGLSRSGWNIDLSAIMPTGGPITSGDHRIWPTLDLSTRSLRASCRSAFGSKPAKVVTLTDLGRMSGCEWDFAEVACWVPLCFDPLPPEDLLRLRDARHVLTMSQWATGELGRHGVQARYMPLAVDVSSLAPEGSGGQAVARRRHGLPPDAFLVGFVGVNNEWEANRKSLPEALMAFAELRRRHPDAVLVLHSHSGHDRGGLDVSAILDALDVPAAAVRTTNVDRYHLGFSRAEMGDLYRSLDVLLAPSAGEGFGLPVIEAQACGVPVIVSDFTAQPELVGAGWIVGGQRRWAPWARSWLMTPNVGEITDALLDAYNGTHRQSPRGPDLAARFDIGRVLKDYWQPFLGEWNDAPK